MLDELYVGIFQKIHLRYMVYPFWAAAPATGQAVAAVLAATLAGAAGYAGFQTAKGMTGNMGRLQTPSRLMAGATLAAITWLAAEPLIEIGKNISTPKQLLIMGAVFWPVVLMTAVLLAVKYLKPHILIRKTRDYRDYYLRGTRIVDASEFNRKAVQAFRFLNEQYEPIRIGKLVIPVGAENYHFAIQGTTGAGKSQVMYQFVNAINGRNQSMIIYDVGGDFRRRFGRPQDRIFNPFMDGSFPWNPLKEIEREQDCYTLAAAICTSNEADHQGKRWTEYGRSFIASVLSSMHGSDDLEQFLYWVMEAGIPELAAQLEGTPAAAYVQEGNEEVFQSIRTTVVAYMQTWPFLIRHISQHGSGGIGIRSYVRESASGKQTDSLYITVKDSEMSALKNMIATFYSMAIQESLDIPVFKHRLWFFMDELDSLGCVTSLKDGLTKLRKHYVSIVLGFQTVSQLHATYGKEITDVLLVNARMKIVMNCQGTTAEIMSKWFGQQEVKRVIRTRTDNTGSVLNTESRSTVSSGKNIQILTTSTVMASELSGLPNLTGYMMISDGLIGKFSVKYQ